jgi:hypothetical protein
MIDNEDVARQVSDLMIDYTYRLNASIAWSGIAARQRNFTPIAERSQKS